MRYYPILDLDIKSVINKLKDAHTVIEEGELILSHNGLYKYEKGGIFLYKLKTTDIEEIILDNFINDIKFIKTNDLWERKEKIFNIPYFNKVVKYKIFNFSLSPKGETKFIVEIINDTINYYFKTPNENSNDNTQDYNDISIFIKQDICLFFEKLK